MTASSPTPLGRAVRLPAVVVLLLVVAAFGPGATGAHAVDQGKGRPGFCPTATGVTVVVDFQALSGTTVVRCYPGKAPGTGLDALKGAGFQIEGVQRWGEAFICRVENRPAAGEKVPLKGNPGYRERCVDTPPAAGYWSYWHAGNNCTWDYSQWGVKNRAFIPGGFEGWSFSLNATADTNPEPRIAPVRPGTSGQQCAGHKEPAPTSNDPAVQQPGLDDESGGARGRGGGSGGSGGDGGSTDTSDSGSDTRGPGSADGKDGRNHEDDSGDGDGQASRGTDTEALPPPRPRDAGTPPAGAAEAVPDPKNNVKFTGGENADDVNRTAREQSGASDLAPWVAGAAIVLLAAAGWTTARRRKRAREA